ncbi:serine/threonine-protein kinase [Roseateles saccharophilus]|uniref:Serine/threonine protein kinase n=2 Tax=Pseudomonadota TaxID=1224 RepID=A0A4R3VKL3_ROSSA|nr:serine/threonine-protein kinase [Roseateles saccharophilus]MDG0831238.1 cyclic nucleotide-binding domain-containing protein [Roseateles saccharophilus]TCV04359.1 serine/threonine protein kinase [Roseateles saccharophilus]
MPRVTALADDLPSHIGRYQVLKRLGEGATSDVFLARDPFQGQDVAIKRMRAWAPPADAPSSDFSNRFFSAEAALAGRLNHPNVVAILDAVAEDSSPYLVMEYVPGVTLKHFCRSDRLLALDQIVELGFKCAMALSYVYRQGVIHRDVKPANLLAVLDSGQVVDVKVSDFGSALNLNADATQIHRVGSLAYMPPEQIEGGDVDCRADIYALGAVLYHLISGRAPFDAPHQMALMHQIYHQPPLPLVGQREGVSEALDAVVLRALAKAPHDRFPDWESFAQALSALVAGQQVPLNRLGEVRDSERFNLLRSLEFFADFGDVQLWEVVRRARWKRYPPGYALFKRGQEGNSFHIIAQGEVEVFRDGRLVATLGQGTSVGEMAYLAPNPDLRRHSTDIKVSQECTTISFTPESIGQLSPECQHRFDRGFIRVLVRRLHAAHEALAHPRRIL